MRASRGISQVHRVRGATAIEDVKMAVDLELIPGCEVGIQPGYDYSPSLGEIHFLFP